MTEVQQKAKRVRLRQVAAHAVPLLHDFGALGDGRKVSQPTGCRVVVESEIGGAELLLQDRHSRKQSQRSAFDFVGRTQQNLTLALEIRARGSATDIFGESQHSVVKDEMEVRPVDGSAADAIQTVLIQPNRSKTRVQASGS